VRLLLGGLLGLVGLTPTAPTGLGYEFDWQPVPGCPDEATVAAYVEGYLGHIDGAARGRQPVKLLARVSHESGEFIARLASDLPERVFNNKDCDALAQYTAFAAAMQIEALIAAGPVNVVAAGPEEVGVATMPPPPPPPVRAPQRRRSRLRGALRFGAGLAVNDLPGATTALRMTGALLWQRVRLEIEASYLPKRPARFEDEPSYGLDLQIAAGGLRSCPTVRRRIEILVCAGAEAGAIHGLTVDTREAGVTGFIAVNFGLAILYNLHRRVAVGALVEGAYRVARPSFIILQSGTSNTYPLTQKPESVRILAGVEMRLP